MYLLVKEVNDFQMIESSFALINGKMKGENRTCSVLIHPLSAWNEIYDNAPFWIVNEDFGRQIKSHFSITCQKKYLLSSNYYFILYPSIFETFLDFFKRKVKELQEGHFLSASV